MNEKTTNTTKASASAGEAAAAAAQAPDDVEKIRDIIFGGQMREYATRFQQLEKHVADSMERIAKELDRRFDKLEQELQSRTAALDERLKAEAGEREAVLQDLRHSVAAGHKSFTELVEKNRIELSEALQADADRLERQKVTSRDLAQLFTALARQLEQNGQSDGQSDGQ